MKNAHPQTPKEKIFKASVLVVEDDPFMRSLLVQKLALAEFGVSSVTNGREALTFLDTNDPDVMLLDIVMPDVDGFQVLQEMQKTQRTQKIIVIVLSNLGEKENIERAKKLGAYDYLVKANFVLDEIIYKIQISLKNKHKT